MEESLEIKGYQDTEPYIKLATLETMQETVGSWKAEGQLVEESFPGERLAVFKEKARRRFTAVSPQNPIHNHPDSEFIILSGGSEVRIQFLNPEQQRKTVTYENSGVEKQMIEIAPHTIHLLVLIRGPLTILTTKRNLKGVHYPSFAASRE